MNRNWSCIVITCPSLSSVIATEREVEFLKLKGRIPNSVCILTIEDPAKNLGSGAATLNALLVAVEYLSAKQNYMVLTSDVLLQGHVLILHNGRDSLYSCSGKAFISLPLEYVPEDKSKPYCSGILSNLEAAFQLIGELSLNSPHGVWVCSTDMLILQIEKSYNLITWENIADVVMFSIHVDIEYATDHGVISNDDKGCVSDILYCQPFDQIKDFAEGNGKVPIVSGIVFFKTTVAESLLALHVESPLDSCTYLGLDCGNQPIQVSLYFDFLIAMATNMSRENFISGNCGKLYNNKFGIQTSCSNENMLARSLIWNELSNYRMSAKVIPNSQHLYWSNKGNASYHVCNLLKIASGRELHSVSQTHNSLSSNSSLLVNSCLEAQALQVSSNTATFDSFLSVDNLKIGENCFISGVKFYDQQYILNIPNYMFIMRTSVNKLLGNECFLLFGIQENPFLPVDLVQGTFCNKPWFEIFKRLCIQEDKIWTSDLTPGEKTLMNAKLFTCNLSFQEALDLFLNENSKEKLENLKQKWKSSKKYSIKEIMENINYSANFDHKRSIYAEIACRKLRNSICEDKDSYVLPYFYAACAEGWSDMIMNTLDDVLLANMNSVIKTRTLSCIADLLSIKAGITGGIRSGPGSNHMWNKAFTLLLNDSISEGLKELSNERSHWLSRPDHLMRAARHYEKAAQIFIQNSVKTVKVHMLLNPVPLPEIGVKVTADCPARIDLQGGWSDTPPICYELGGSVVNIAILVDGKKPIGAHAFRIREPYIVLKICLGEIIQTIVIKDMKEVLNYDQPKAKGALLKAALICTDIVDVNCEKTLEEQLLKNFGGGFELQSWSLLPQGCGMGTSSILAGAIVAVLWSVTGRSFGKSAVIHAVLYVEQLLTTGGGWQDQVSGVTGGVNRGYSDPSFPLHVKVEPLEMENAVLKKLNAHLLLIYTGKVRLAKNLLQNVIRNWYAREETVVKCFKDLIKHSFEMKAALLNGDFPEIGQLMEKYWEQKKILAPGCEPASVKEIMDIIKPFCYGQLLVGAGGGGFMCVLTKEPNAEKAIKATLQKYKDHQKLSIHNVTIHKEGLEIAL